MTKENVLDLITTVGALAVGIISLLWPTQAGTWGALIINSIIPAICAIVVALWPTKAAVSAIYRAKAKADYWAGVREGKIAQPRGSKAGGDVFDNVDDVLKGIYKELDSGEVDYKDDKGDMDWIPVAPLLSRELAAYWVDPNVNLAFKQVLLQKTLEITAIAFTTATTLPAPTKYIEVAKVQTYWLIHKVNCAVHSAGLFHAVLLPIRIALKIRDTGAI